MPKTARIVLESRSPLMQSRYHEEPKLNKELADAYEIRTWRSKMHVTENGESVFIPGISFKRALSEAAKYLSESVPGKGKATYTKHIEAGVIVNDDVILNVKPEDVKAKRIHVNADGVRGSGKRVMKTFPEISSWSGVLDLTIVDDILTEEVIKRHLTQAGVLIGVGSFRVRNGGMCGRFGVVSLEWQEC